MHPPCRFNLTEERQNNWTKVSRDTLVSFARQSNSTGTPSPQPLRRRHKVPYQGSNLIGGRVQREVAAVNNVDFGISEHPCDSFPARSGRTMIRICPRSRAAAVAFRASRLATSDRTPHWFGSRRTDRSGSRLGRADSENKTRRSRDRDRGAPRRDRFQHVAHARPRATRRLLRSAFSLAARSAQNARRVFHFCSQAFVVGNGVLHDQRLNSLRMRQYHAKADGAAVVLHV